MNADRHPQIFIISGLDPSGGAGLVADIETVHTLGCQASAIITYQTVQTTQNATACLASDQTMFKWQLYSVIDAQPFSAVTITLHL